MSPKLLNDFGLVPSLVNTVRYAKLMKEHSGGSSSSQSITGLKVSFRQFLTVMIQIADTGFPSLGTRLLLDYLTIRMHLTPFEYPPTLVPL